ncbi:conserved hypothetical protein [Ricinus communis]|uniref:Uncharacterized protein n=1 Tax=Ricinus communis TaxID=3988 RepID=B9T0J1_RICCO|nr:conserved hypothetical protein [Ricinus communis]
MRKLNQIIYLLFSFLLIPPENQVALPYNKWLRVSKQPWQRKRLNSKKGTSPPPTRHNGGALSITNSSSLSTKKKARSCQGEEKLCLKSLVIFPSLLSTFPFLGNEEFILLGSNNLIHTINHTINVPSTSCKEDPKIIKHYFRNTVIPVSLVTSVVINLGNVILSMLGKSDIMKIVKVHVTFL